MICQVCRKEIKYSRLRRINFHADLFSENITLDVVGVCQRCDNPRQAQVEEAAQKVLDAQVVPDLNYTFDGRVQ